MVPFPIPSLWHTEKRRPTIPQREPLAQIAEYNTYKQWITSIGTRTETCAHWLPHRTTVWWFWIAWLCSVFLELPLLKQLKMQYKYLNPLLWRCTEEQNVNEDKHVVLQCSHCYMRHRIYNSRVKTAVFTHPQESSRCGSGTHKIWMKSTDTIQLRWYFRICRQLPKHFILKTLFPVTYNLQPWAVEAENKEPAVWTTSSSHAHH